VEHFLSRVVLKKQAVPEVQRAFTLIEMMVVLTIISIITSIALFGQSGFNKSILLTDTAYNTALSVREMQSLGISSRKFGSVQNPGYGVHFAMSTPTKFTLFADTTRPSVGSIPSNCVVGTAGTPEAKPGNCLYDTASVTDGLYETVTYTRGFYISRICAKNGTTPYCSGPASDAVTQLDVVFLRSSTEAAINVYRGSSWYPMTSAEIYITSAEGDSTRGICISRVGQVSVTLTTCP